MPSVIQMTKRDSRVHRLKDGIGCKGRRNEDDRSVGTGLGNGLRDGVEDRHAFDRWFHPFPGVTPATTLRPVIDRTASM